MAQHVHVREPSVPSFTGEPANPYAAVPIRPYTQSFPEGMDGGSRENLMDNAAPLGNRVLLRGTTPPGGRNLLGVDGGYRGAGR